MSFFKVFVKSEKQFECATNFLEQYECKSCPAFKTSFLIELRQHFKGGHTQQRATEVVYKCLKCPFVTHSKCLSLKHRKFGNCGSDETQRKTGKNGPRNKFACKVVEVGKQGAGGENGFESFLNEILTSRFGGKVKRNVVLCEPPETKDRQKCVLVTSAGKDEKRLFQCELCSYKSAHKMPLKRHILTKHTPEDLMPWFSCQYCTFKTIIKSSLRRHCLTKHATDDRIHWFRCDHCKYKTYEKLMFERHAFKHLPKVSVYKCEHCVYQTANRGNFHKHNNLKHIPKDQVRWFRCQYCSYSSVQKWHVKGHMISKHVPQVQIDGLKCKYCDYQTSQKNKLQRHVDARHAHLLKCGWCSYLSPDQFLLNLHVSLRHKDVRKAS